MRQRVYQTIVICHQCGINVTLAMRVVFGTRDDQRTRQLLSCGRSSCFLCDIAKYPGLYLECVTKHYGPRSPPVTTTPGNDAVTGALTIHWKQRETER